MTKLSLYYRHVNHVPFKFTRREDVEQVAKEVRRQLGAADRCALTIEELDSIQTLSVNGVTYEVWTDREHPLRDLNGKPLLGLFEYEPISSIDAVSVCVSPIGVDMSPQLALSTYAHEFGHAIYDGPALVAGHQQPSLFDAASMQTIQAYRRVTDCQEHLQRPTVKLPKQVETSEWRANEFMGSLLVPRAMLWAAVTQEVHTLGGKIEYAESIFAETLDGSQQILWCEPSAPLDPDLICRAVAPQFGVNPAFIRVRMRRYGILEDPLH